jgi:hypothetical protein
VEQFFQQCISVLRSMPVKVALPECLTEEHERLTKRWKELKRPEYGPCFDELTTAQAALIEPLYRYVFRTARRMVR